MKFVLMGAAGYIAPRHMEAIKELGHELVAAFDPNDSVGVIDRYFPYAAFFTKFDELNSYVNDKKIDFVSICSPNHLHFENIRWAFSIGANAICEKPMVLSTRNLDELAIEESRTGRRVFTVLQLRVHSAIRELREQALKRGPDHKAQVKLTYITSRGPWYLKSWKGAIEKSGGLPFNIGIHFFDMLTWIFGSVRNIELREASALTDKGVFDLDRAHVEWELSIDRTRLPESALQLKQSTFRSVTVDGVEIEFSEGFTELHKTVYRDILEGRGYGIGDAREALAIAEKCFELRQRMLF